MKYKVYIKSLYNKKKKYITAKYLCGKLLCSIKPHRRIPSTHWEHHSPAFSIILMRLNAVQDLAYLECAWTVDIKTDNEFKKRLANVNYFFDGLLFQQNHAKIVLKQLQNKIWIYQEYQRLQQLKQRRKKWRWAGHILNKVDDKFKKLLLIGDFSATHEKQVQHRKSKGFQKIAFVTCKIYVRGVKTVAADRISCYHYFLQTTNVT